MAHSEGFEPSTARFVAEYSIQLSYECVVLFSILAVGGEPTANFSDKTVRIDIYSVTVGCEDSRTYEAA